MFSTTTDRSTSQQRNPRLRRIFSTILVASLCVIMSLQYSTVANALVAAPPGSTPSSPDEHPNPPVAAPVIDHSAYDALLQKYVDDERVDYAAWMKNDDDRAALKKYLDRLAVIDPATLEKKEKLAFYINLYNATMLDQAMEQLAPNSSPSAEGFAIFDDEIVRYKGGKISLNDLEHKIIRPTFDDPRVQVALCNATISSPPLMNHAYKGETIDKTLDANMKKFINDNSRNQIDMADHKLVLSSIFDWYASDFGGRSALPAYIAKYLDKPTDLKGFTVDFLPYNWHLNIVQK